MSNATKQRLLSLFRERAFSKGHFVLASGKESNYYINSKKALFHSEINALLADSLWEIASELDIDAIGGLEVGAIPLTATLAYKYHLQGRSVEGFFVRKQPKTHGSQDRIEGVLQEGFRVAVLDDVLTTGGSALQAIEQVEAVGAKVVAVLCIVDRLEGAKAKLEPSYPLHSVFTIRDFGVEPPSE